MNRPTPLAVVLSYGCAVLLGLFAVLSPIVFFSLKPQEAPLFPIVRTAIEGLSWPTFVFLFVGGLPLGAFGRGNPVLLGLTTMAIFPLIVVAEVIADSTSHNLLPLEIAMYGFISISAVIGASLGRFAVTRLRGPAVVA